MLITSHGISQTRPSLTLNVGICIETMYPLAAVNLSYPVYHETVHLTGGFTFFNIGHDDPAWISEVNPFRTNTSQYLESVGSYRVYQFFIGSQIGKIVFLQPKLSYNLFGTTSTVGLGVNAGVMFPSKNNFRFGFTLGYDDIEIGTERKSYASTGIISATLLLQITMK